MLIMVFACWIHNADYSTCSHLKSDYCNNIIENINKPLVKKFNTNSTVLLLTLWEPPGFGDFRKKNSSFRLPYQRPSSSAHCARELFSGSNGSASLVDCTRKKFFAWGVRFFFEWRHKWRTFWPPWPTLPGPGRQPLGGSVLLKFLLEKLSYNPSLLILWMTCWGFGFKSCDVS